MLRLFTSKNGLQMCVGEPVGWVVGALQDRAAIQDYIAQFPRLVVQVRGLACFLNIVPVGSNP